MGTYLGERDGLLGNTPQGTKMTQKDGVGVESRVHMKQPCMQRSKCKLWTEESQ